MLVIARKVGQSLLIGEEIEVLITEVRGDQVRLGIAAPREVAIRRKELVDAVRRGTAEAAADSDAAAAAVRDLLPAES
ncbi:MAG: carbon storage regulator [Armatimonadetes bacterium]|nr:carbon storage regulator [Armatimonadota bacterium]